MTAKEVSSRLNLPLQRIYDLTRRGAIPAVRFFRQYRYDSAALDEWVRRGGVVEGNSADMKGAK